MTAPRTLALLVLLLTLPALGQAPAGAAPAAQARKKKVIRLDAMTVEGRIQKPQAFYILQRQSLNFDGLELKKSFVPKIEKSVERQPF